MSSELDKVEEDVDYDVPIIRYFLEQMIEKEFVDLHELSLEFGSDDDACMTSKDWERNSEKVPQLVDVSCGSLWCQECPFMVKNFQTLWEEVMNENAEE